MEGAASMPSKLTPILKAIYGALTAGLGAAATAYADGVITGQEGVFIAIAALGAFGVIWGVPNYPKPAPPPTPALAPVQAKAAE